MKKSGSDKNQLYTSKETVELLNISPSTLRNLVEKGLIEKVVPVGYKHGYYTKKSVDQYHKESLIFDDLYSSRQVEGSTRGKEIRNKMIKVTTIEDMKRVAKLSQEIFGIGEDLVEDRMKIVERNQDTYYLLTREEDPVGYLSIMPLKKGNLEKVLRQTLPVRIDPEQIETFEKGKKLDLFLTTIGTKPGITIEEKREYGSRLVRQLIRVIIELGEKGVELGTIAARSNSPDGVRLMKHAGFTEIVPLTPERRTFIINVRESGIPFILQYKRDLEESKATTQE